VEVRFMRKEKKKKKARILAELINKDESPKEKKD